MNCPRCSEPVERVWTGKKSAMVEPKAVTAYVPQPGQPDVFHKTTGVRIGHKCRGDGPLHILGRTSASPETLAIEDAGEEAQ